MKEFFKHLRSNRTLIKVHAGCIPRPYADLAVEKGVEQALHQSKVRKYIAPDETCAVSDTYYNLFESMMTGRDINDNSLLPDESLRCYFYSHII
jgi:hypothetical protein